MKKIVLFILVVATYSVAQTLGNNITGTSANVTGVVAVGNGGTGSTTGFTSTGVVGLFTSCSGTQYLGADGACHTASGSGTVTVVGSGSLTSTAIVTGGGTTTLQTPATTATMDSSGNISTPGSVTAGGIVISGATITPTTSTAALTLSTQSASSSGTIGSVLLAGGFQTGTGGTNSLAGGIDLSGGNNAGTSGSSQAGSTEVEPGESSAGGLQGLMVFGYQATEGVGTTTQWNLQCWTSANQITVNDCGASPTDFVGVTDYHSGSAVEVHIPPSESPINASSAVTLYHTVCAGSTPGKVTDSGGTGPCPAGSGITVGRVIAIDGGARTLADGASFTPSSTLPLIAMTNRQQVGPGDISGTLPASQVGSGYLYSSLAGIVPSGTLSASQIGVSPGGVDFTGTSDSGPGINTAMGLAANGTLSLANGNLKISTTVVIPAGVHLKPGNGTVTCTVLPCFVSTNSGAWLDGAGNSTYGTVIQYAATASTITDPAAMTVTPTGSGSTGYCYTQVAYTALGHTMRSPWTSGSVGCTTNGATLGSAVFNSMTTATGTGYTGVDVYRVQMSNNQVQGKITRSPVTPGAVVVDKGDATNSGATQAADTLYAPTVNTTGGAVVSFNCGEPGVNAQCTGDRVSNILITNSGTSGVAGSVGLLMQNLALSEQRDVTANYFAVDKEISGGQNNDADHGMTYNSDITAIGENYDWGGYEFASHREFLVGGAIGMKVSGTDSCTMEADTFETPAVTPTEYLSDATFCRSDNTRYEGAESGPILSAVTTVAGPECNGVSIRDPRTTGNMTVGGADACGKIKVSPDAETFGVQNDVAGAVTVNGSASAGGSITLNGSGASPVGFPISVTNAGTTLNLGSAVTVDSTGNAVANGNITAVGGVVTVGQSGNGALVKEFSDTGNANYAYLEYDGPTNSGYIQFPDVGSSGTAKVAYGLPGTTGTITGTALTATCDSGTATVTGATVGSPVSVSSTTGADVGGAFNLRASVTSSGTVTVYVCGTGTPSSLAYNVYVLQ